MNSSCDNFFLVNTTFFTLFFKQYIKFEAKYDIQHDKNSIFLHQALDYNLLYNFILNHYYKFKIIVMLKDVWASKFKSVYVFLFFECFEHMDPFLWNVLKFTKNWNDLVNIYKEKKLLKQKNHMSTCFSWMF
jgi:hypothetical protein